MMGDQQEHQILVNAVLAGRYDAVEQGFDALSKSDRSAFVGEVLNVLETTSSHAARDTAAIVLSELLVPEAKPILVKLLGAPCTLGHRGTLIGALGEYDCVPHLELLCRLALEGRFEVNARAAGLLRRTLDAQENQRRSEQRRRGREEARLAVAGLEQFNSSLLQVAVPSEIEPDAIDALTALFVDFDNLDRLQARVALAAIKTLRDLAPEQLFSGVSERALNIGGPARTAVLEEYCAAARRLGGALEVNEDFRPHLSTVWGRYLELELDSPEDPDIPGVLSQLLELRLRVHFDVADLSAVEKQEPFGLTALYLFHQRETKLLPALDRQRSYIWTLAQLLSTGQRAAFRSMIQVVSRDSSIDLHEVLSGAVGTATDVN